MNLRIYDGFETKTEAKKQARNLRKQGVQYVRVKELSSSRLKWGVYVGGRNSRKYA